MKAKQQRLKLKLEPGIHAVYISEVKAVLNADKTVLTLTDGTPAIDIIFKDADGKIATMRYWKKDDNRWILEGILSAAGKNPKEEISARQMLGNWLWIIVAKEVVYENGLIKRDMDGKAVEYMIVETLFFKYDGADSKPYIPTDPALNNGYCSGEFYRERNTINPNTEKGIQIGHSTVKDYSTGF